MYMEPKPVSTYGLTEGWKMPSPQPSESLKRPPMVKTGNSDSSSLRGMEVTAPSFQSFLKRTPPPDLDAPLPPTPLIPRRRSSFTSTYSSPSRRPSWSVRRSSSIYSRTPSQWFPDREEDILAVPSWQTADFADPNLLLRPIAYSASTSQLVGKQPTTAQMLEPRTYSPLINAPSPTISRRTTPSPAPQPPQPRPSILLPPPVDTIQVPKKHLRTVSLEKAKEMLQAPGAVHLLPEELRAQTLGKARSQEPLRATSMDIMSGRMTPPELPEAPTLVDNQGRERLLSIPRDSLSPITSPGGYPFPTVTSPVAEDIHLFHVGDAPMKTMAPLAAQARQESRAKAAQALGLAEPDEPRGRTKTRGPRKMSYEHYLPKQQKRISDESITFEDLQNDAQAIAQEYHNLLSEQYRQPSASSASFGTNGSDTEVRAHMKMVPQPLFHAKPAARISNATFGRGSESSASPFHMRTGSGFADGHRPSFGSPHRRCSTSGSIPISPPSLSLHTIPNIISTPPPETPQKRIRTKSRRNSDDNRVSAYYPYVMSGKAKKGSKSKDKQGAGMTGAGTPPLPMLAADIIAQLSRTPEVTPDGSPFGHRPSPSVASQQSEYSTASSDKVDVPLHKRMMKGAVKYADLLTRPAESPSRRSHERRRSHDSSSSLARVVSPESPHLLPSPASSKAPPPIHLGWSDQAKNKFDQARSSLHLPKYPPEPAVTHIQLPARPLHETRNALKEPESPGRKGSIFGGLMDSWRESKADKRREELKKMIKVVTPADEVRAKDDSGTDFRPSAVVRRLSAYNWM